VASSSRQYHPNINNITRSVGSDKNSPETYNGYIYEYALPIGGMDKQWL